MNNSQNVALTIKQLAKNRNIQIKKMLADCELSINTLSTMQAGGSYPRMETIVKIAEYLDCSIDYLLGRTDSPQTTGGHFIKIEDIHGDHSANVNIGESIDRETLEIAQMIKKLSIVERAEIILKTNEMINKNKE